MTRKRVPLPSFTARHPYRIPPVKKGTESPLPESRSDVILKMQNGLGDVAPKAYRQNFSNGEFISSSLIIGITFEAVADRSLDLENASDTAYYDPQLKLWWRRGGCFD